MNAPRVMLIGSTIVSSWLGMQAVHELGHVCGAWVSGGRVERVVLHPLTISRTDLAENPAPLVVVWAGPLTGVVLPLIAWLVAVGGRIPARFVLRFFAGFCLVANGLYVGVGSFWNIGDCGEMLHHGSQPWQLWLFGLVTISVGIWLWHGQGKHFGLGPAAKPVSPRVAYAALAVSVVVVAAELLWSAS